ncbi:uncharacterized protein CELE_Y66D12A.6 [Caenorhabditis elegans]|uniref:Uncharacterized protein n=1 Tax=Caenorhabditis elegans TaxID=6239 RepID=Q9BI39_CAEEL|nr:Uncharacterized protein CELE_Y66D12A.6 [Caenorhabditis elegans]CAC35908.1 Uncharacterized protein CELE_Y66D12A.6 [Caenorhabditis elegans]|eukprot:NP_499496.1 Uncharacterized protein CELE_Y66D12A.6 [Caenorhabditis elegans]
MEKKPLSKELAEQMSILRSEQATSSSAPEEASPAAPGENPPDLFEQLSILRNFSDEANVPSTSSSIREAFDRCEKLGHLQNNKKRHYKYWFLGRENRMHPVHFEQLNELRNRPPSDHEDDEEEPVAKKSKKPVEKK